MNNGVDPARLAAYLQNTSLVYKTRSNSYILECPRCNKRDKLYIRRRDGRFRCFKCAETNGFKGRPEYALAELLNLPVAVVQEQLYDITADAIPVHLDLSLRDFLDPEEELEEEISTIQWPWNFYPINHKNSARGLAYLESRGIPLDIAMEYDLRYNPLRRRVGFPVTMDGNLVGYQERLIIPNKNWDDMACITRETPKILGSDDLPRESVLMFEHRITSDHAILTEGPFDALKCHLAGGNVCAMGKAVTRSQLQVLRNAGVQKVYLGLDPDALDETARIVRNEFKDLECYLMLPPRPYSDLGEMDMNHVLELFKSAPKVHSATLFAFMR